MPDEKQVLMFNRAELSLIKTTFAENEPLLYAVRKVMHQFKLSDEDKVLLKRHISPAVIRAMRKRILPEISNEFPIGQLPSLLVLLGKQFELKNYEEMEKQLDIKKLELDYIEQQLKVLRDTDAPQPIKLAGMASLSAKDRFIGVSAYLFLLGYLDPACLFIRAIAGEKEETPEEQAKRITRDSSR